MRNNYDDQLDESQIPDANAADGFNEYEDMGSEVAERKVGSEPVPGFGYYVAAPRGATPAFAFDDKTRPIIRHRLEIVEGPEGTVGRMAFVDQPMACQRDKWTDQKDANGRAIREPLTAEELGEAIRKFKNVLNRVAQVFGFELKAPKDKSLAALGTYASQFEKAGENGVTFVAEIKKNTRNGFTKNLMYFDSIAALTDAPQDSKSKAKTAHEEAKQKIAEKNKALDAQAKKNGGSGSRGGAKSTAAQAPALD